MKKLSNYLMLLTVFTVVQCKNADRTEEENKEQSGHFEISGTINNMQEGKVFLEEVNSAEDVEAKLDSSMIKEGKFTFTGGVDYPKRYRIKVADTTVFPLYFYLSNDRITVTAVKDSLSKAEITGANFNAVIRDYYDNNFEKVHRKAGPIYKLSDSLTQRGKVRLTANQQAMMDRKWEALNLFNDSITEAFIRNNSNSQATPLIITQRYIQYPNPEKAQEFYDLLDAAAQSSYYGVKLAEALEGYKAIAIGSQAPAIKNQVDLDGNMISLADYKGKYVLVDFWASWCGPCRKENPNVKKAYDQYHKKGLEILAISLDDKRDLWEKAIKADNLPWQHVSDLKGFKNEAAQTYSVSAIPQNFLIDPEGIIIAANLRGEGLHRELKKVFDR